MNNQFNYIIESNAVRQNSQEITDFLLSTCDQITWTNYDEGLIFKKQWEKDPEFIKQMQLWQPYLLKKFEDDLEYGEIQHKNKTFRHYVFSIKEDIRDAIQKEGPIITRPGFWDPMFYNGEKLVAAVIAHEPIISFSIAEKEANRLFSQGVPIVSR